MGTPMSAAQAAQQDNRDGGGRYAEKQHTDPGDVALGLVDENRLLSPNQLAYVTDLAGILGGEACTLRTETSCGGHRYAAVETIGTNREPGVPTRVWCEFNGAAGMPCEVQVSSDWKWMEKAGPYDTAGVGMLLPPGPQRDLQAIAEQLAELGRMQDQIDQRVNKPRWNLPDGDWRTQHAPHLQLAGQFGVTRLHVHQDGDTDSLVVEAGRFTEAYVQTRHYGELNIRDDNQLRRIVRELGFNLAFYIPGADTALPGAKNRECSNEQVEQFLFGTEE